VHDPSGAQAFVQPPGSALRSLTENTGGHVRRHVGDRAAIYNEGIADQVATFENEPRSATDITGWFAGQHIVMVAETGETGPVAFAASFPHSSRPCYRGIGEFSVYVRRDYRGLAPAARCSRR
jgi:hypothetical protein